MQNINCFSLISDDGEIKELLKKFTVNGFHYSPYKDPNRIWDSYKLLEENDLDKLGKCSFVSRCNLGKRCHLFLIRVGGVGRVYILDAGHFYRCEELETCFEASLFYGTLLDCEMIDSSGKIIFIVMDVLALGGTITEKIKCIQQEPPFPVCIDAKPFPLETRLDFARLLFEDNGSEFFLRNCSFEFRIHKYYHITEFDELVMRVFPNDTEFPNADTVLFQSSNFDDMKYIYNIRRENISKSGVPEASIKMLQVFKDKYPGIWSIVDGKGFRGYLFVPSPEHYKRLQTISNYSQIPCAFNKAQEMWMPAF